MIVSPKMRADEAIVMRGAERFAALVDTVVPERDAADAAIDASNTGDQALAVGVDPAVG